MRLHSMILAVAHHTPFIGITYGQKTNTLLEDIDWQYAHSSGVGATDILQNINSVETNYKELTEKLSNHHVQYQTQYIASFPGK